MLRFFGKLLAALLALPLLYLLAALMLGNIVREPPRAAATRDITVYLLDNGVHTDITVYLLDNGVHTDLALPLNNAVFDWTTVIDPADARQLYFPPDDSLPPKVSDKASRRRQYAFVRRGDATPYEAFGGRLYVAFGWGNRAFYLETPQWRDMKVATAFKAVAGLGDTVIHATFLPQPRATPNSVAIDVSADEYRALAASIVASLQTDSPGRAQVIVGRAYGDNDAFYAAHGSYSLFNTCNSWTNHRLKAAGLKHIFWTPFAHTLVAAYR